MKKYLRGSIKESKSHFNPIVSAEGTDNEALDDAIDELKSNFDYAIDGFDKLARNGKEGQNKANQILLQLAEAVEIANKAVASAITGQGGQQ